MEINGFALGSQYTVPIGTVITFNGADVTITDPNGNVVNEAQLTDEDKLDPSKPFGSLESSNVTGTESSTSNQNTTGSQDTNSNGTNSTTDSNNNSNSSNNSNSNNDQNGVAETPSFVYPNNPNDNDYQKPTLPDGNFDQLKPMPLPERPNDGFQKPDITNPGITPEGPDWTLPDTVKPMPLPERPNDGFQKPDITNPGITPEGPDWTLPDTVKPMPLPERPTIGGERSETVNVDEQGNVLQSLDGYKLISSSVKDKIVTENGQIITVHVTTNVYHKIVTTNKTVEVNVDEQGNVLSDLTGYVKVDQKQETKTETAENGDITNTTTITTIYHKTQTINKSVVVNKDEAGNILGETVNEADYHKMSTSEPVVTTETAANGDTIVTSTVTNIYHKIVITTKNVTINKDKDTGEVLESTTGYTKVSESTDTTTVTNPTNGDLTQTITTTILWTKTPVESTIDGVVAANDPTLQKLLHQVTVDDTIVTRAEASQVTSVSFAQLVASKFNVLINQKESQLGVNVLSPAYDATDEWLSSAARAIEENTNADHNSPSNGSDPLDNTPFTSFGEALDSGFTIFKQAFGGNRDTLASLIANQLYKDWIVNEEASNGGHYRLFTTDNFDQYTLGTLVVDNGNTYRVSAQARLGNIDKDGGDWGGIFD